MEKTSLIKINKASAEEIAELFGIGPNLAQRIVAFRENNGYIHNPEELAQVKGISINLAITLTPMIDWEIPVQPKQSKERDRLGLLVFLLVEFAILWAILRQSFPIFHASLVQSQDSPVYYVRLWITGSILVTQIISALAVGAIGIAGYSTALDYSKRLNRIALFLFLIGGLGIISTGLGNLIHYQFLAENGWIELINNQAALAALAWSIGFILILMPSAVAVYYPNQASNTLLARIYDLAITILSPVFAWMAWVSRAELPTFISIMFGLAGVYFAYIGYMMIRSGKSLFRPSLLIFIDEYVLQKASDSAFWRTWLNARLPDVNQQRKLKDALDEIYPPSRIKSIAGAIIFGAGGWIIITTVTSILDWIIQKGLDKLWP